MRFDRYTLVKAISLALGSQLLSLGLIYGALRRPRALPLFSPFGETEAGAIANSALLLAAIATAGFGSVLLVRSQRIVLLRLFIVGTTGLASFLLSLLLLPAALELTGLRLNPTGRLLVALPVPVLAALAMRQRTPRALATLATIILAAEAGAYFTLILKPPTLLVAPIVFALYDIFAVLRGPLRWLAQHDALLQLGPLVARWGDLTLGLGDLAFYALLPAAAALLAPSSVVLLTILVTNLGLVVTVLGLSYREALPGLPLPILFGTAVVTLAWLTS